MKRKGTNAIKIVSLVVLAGFSVFAIAKLGSRVVAEDTAGKITLKKTAKAIETSPGSNNYRKAKVTLKIGTSELKQKYTDVVLVLDNSNSMDWDVCVRYKLNSTECAEEDKKINVAKKSAKSLVDKLIPEGTSDLVKIGVVNFGTKLRASTKDYSEMSSDASVAKDLIDKAKPDGGTNLQTGLSRAKKILAESKATNKIIILISDGEPTYFDYGTEVKILCGTGNEDKPGYKKACAKSGLKPSTAALKESDELKTDPINAEIYAIGFGPNIAELEELLKKIASPDKTDSKVKHSFTAINLKALEDSMDLIAKNIKNILATNATVTDVIPKGFKLTQESIDALKAKYKDAFSFVENDDGTTTITLTNKEISSVVGTYIIEYEVEADKDHYGAMYTNDEATFEATPTKDNSYYKNNNITKINEPFEKPIVQISAVTENDSYSVKEGDTLSIPKINGIKKNDSTTIHIDRNDEFKPSSVKDEIIIVKNPTCGTLNVNNADGSFTYEALEKCAGTQTFTYKIKSTITIEGNTYTAISNTSTVTIKVDKNPTTYTVKYLEKDTNNPLSEAKKNIPGNVFDPVTEEAKTIEEYDLFIDKEIIDKDGKKTKSITLQKEAKNNVITFFYVKKTPVVPDPIVTKTIKPNDKITSLKNEVKYTLKITDNIKDFKGDLKITFVDKLPYEIDENKSNFNCSNTNNCEYKYDSTNKELTLVITIKDVNTYNEKDKTYHLNYSHDIELQYIYEGLDGTETNVTNELVGKVTVGKITKEDPADPTPIPFDVKGKVVVRHVEEIENGSYKDLVTPLETQKGKVGAKYTTSPKENVDGKGTYRLVRDKLPRNAEGNYTEETITVIYVYEKIPASYTVKYLEKGTGNVLTEEETVTGHFVNDEVTENALTGEEKGREILKEYTLDGEAVQTITLKDGTNTILFYYVKKNTEITTPDIHKDGPSSIDSLKNAVKYDLSYKTTIKNYKGDVTLTLVDKLPKKIIESKSDYKCSDTEKCKAEYSKENNTITYTIVYKGVNTFESGQDFKIDFKKSIKIYYDENDFAGTEANIINKLETIVNAGITKDKNIEEKTPIDVMGNVKIKYVEKANETHELKEATTLFESPKKIGTAYETTAPASIKDYKLVGPKEENTTGKVKEGTTIVTYLYERVPATVEATINKDSKTTEITSRDSKVSYTIDYSTTIKNYAGKVNIKIIDYLPYEIDVEKSSIGTGVYDSKTKTITWEYSNIPVDTYAPGNTTGSYRLGYSLDIKLLYKDVDLTKPSLNNKVKGIVEVEGLPEKVVEDNETTTNITVKGKIIVRHVEKLEDGSYKDLVKKLEKADKVGKNYTTNPETISGYKLDKTPENATGIYTEDTITVIYEYKKIPASYTVKYLEKDTNVALVPEKLIPGKFVNDKIKETAKTGKDADVLKEYDVYGDKEKTLTLIDGENVIIFLYTHKKTSVDQPKVVKTGPKNITSLDNKVKYDISYKTTVKNYKGNITLTIVDTLPKKIIESKSEYKCSDAEKCTAKYNATNNTITYTIVYEGINTFESGKDYKIDFNKSINIYYDENDFDGSETSITNILNTNIKVGTKEVNEPGKVETPIGVKGKLNVRYVYENNGTYKDIDSSLNTSSEAKVGTPYETSKKDIKGYTFQKVVGNETGKYKEGTIIVLYVYTKSPSKVIQKPVVTKKSETTEISHTNQSVVYNLTYRTEIANFKGTAKIEIKDTLEYPASKVETKDKSWIVSLDASKKVVTFTKNREIDTYATLDNNKAVIDENLSYTVTYSGFNAENDSDGKLTNKAKGSITLTAKETGTEVQKDIPLNVLGNVEVKFLEKGTGKVLNTSKKIFAEDKKVGTPYTATPNVIPGYKLNSSTPNTNGIVKEKLTTVIYYYERLGATPENPVFTKTGTTSITNIKDLVKYNISYSAIIKGYTGNLKIEIVDYLPYPIDLSKSNIDGGTYNSEAKTITWVIRDLQDVTPEMVFDIEETRTLSLSYIGINPAGDKFANKAQVIITDGTDRTPETPIEHPTTIDVKGTVTATYVDEKGSRIEGIDDVKTEGKVGTKYETSAKEIAGYELTNDPTNKTGNYIDGAILVKYIYKKKPITVTNESITKTSTIEKIIHENQQVDYQINYESTIKYRGNIVVTITDYLPLPIDVSKSELAGGSYNENSRTITWKQSIPNINSYLSEKGFKIGIQKNIKLSYLNIPSNGSVKNKVKVTIKTDEGVTTPQTAEKEIPTYIVGDLKVEHIYVKPDGTKKVLKDYELKNQYVGTAYITSAEKFDGYELNLLKKPSNAQGTIVEGKTTVIYYYVRSIAEIGDNKVEKTGAKKPITSSNNSFDYTIKYKTEIYDYIGPAQIKIVDTLPYEIDETKSVLNGGVYDKKSKTITWNITKDVNTYQNINKNLTIDLNIKLFYKDLDASKREVTNSVKSYLDLETIEDTITDEDEETTKVEISGKVIVNYVDQYNNKLSEQLIKTGLVGEEYGVNPIEIPEYVLVKTLGNEKGKYINGEIVITYVYEKDGTGNVEPPQTKANTNSLSLFLSILSSLLLGTSYILRKKFN